MYSIKRKLDLLLTFQLPSMKDYLKKKKEKTSIEIVQNCFISFPFQFVKLVKIMDQVPLNFPPELIFHFNLKSKYTYNMHM